MSDIDNRQGQKLQNCNLLYTQDVNCANGRGMMNDLLNELNDRSMSSVNEKQNIKQE